MQVTQAVLRGKAVCVYVHAGQAPRRAFLTAKSVYLLPLQTQRFPKTH